MALKAVAVNGGSNFYVRTDRGSVVVRALNLLPVSPGSILGAESNLNI